MIFRNRTYGPAGGETLEQKKARWALWTERLRRWNGIERIGPFFCHSWLIGAEDDDDDDDDEDDDDDDDDDDDE